MAVVKHIGAISALKVGFVVYALLGFLAGLVCSAEVSLWRPKLRTWQGQALGTTRN